MYEKKHNSSVENASVGDSLEEEAFTEKVRVKDDNLLSNKGSTKFS